MLYKITTHEGKLIKYFSDYTCNGVICRFCDDTLGLWDSYYNVFEYSSKKWKMIIANIYF